MDRTFRQQRLRRLYGKGIALIIILALAAGIYALVLRYWHILDAYVYTLEFHLMFQKNNLAAANLPLFSDYFQAMGLKGQMWVMAFLTLTMQNFWLLWTQPLVGPALMTAFGLATGSLVTLLLHLLVGCLCFGVGIFFLGDLLPFILGEEWWQRRRQPGRWLRWGFLTAMALPFVPLSLPGLLAGLARLPWLTYMALLTAGSVIRGVLLAIAWLVLRP